MKKVCTILFLAFISIFSNAQNFPKSGATWVFDRGPIPYADSHVEKWEYIGDSVVVGGTLKKIKATIKYVNPNWAQNDSTQVDWFIEHFLYAGDTVRSLANPGNILANFGLAIGDSSYTPYLHHFNFTQLAPGCNDSGVIYQKGVVVDKGIEMQDGIDSRFYKLRFIIKMELRIPQNLRSAQS